MASAYTKHFKRLLALLALVVLTVSPSAVVHALGSPDPVQNGNVGIEGTIPSPPPTQAATITTPRSGQTFTATPITVAGICKTDLLIKLFANNVFVGSTVCKSGSYSLKIDLFSGKNDLVARVYDSLDQEGPDSNVVSVTFNDAQFAQFGSRVSLTSNYARKGANPGVELVWPIVLSGGSGPYAVSVEWGDGKADSLFTVSFPGNINIKHIYDTAGVYSIIVKATDKNGTTAYLQLVGIANGEAKTTTTSGSTTSGTSSGGNSGDTLFGTLGWALLILLFPFMIASFWLGSRHELYVIRKRIEKSRQQAGSL
ncbi:PKD domain-containing protein [Candidatus Saccharibacteria bacterium]|nr:PKD domain-containing protein [Candidatus Saccharibacteria bacterium]